MASKSQVPRGATKKVKCKCGRLYYPRLIGSSFKLKDACDICKPSSPDEEKKR